MYHYRMVSVSSRQSSTSGHVLVRRHLHQCGAALQTLLSTKDLLSSGRHSPVNHVLQWSGEHDPQVRVPQPGYLPCAPSHALTPLLIFLLRSLFLLLLSPWDYGAPPVCKSSSRSPWGPHLSGPASTARPQAHYSQSLSIQPKVHVCANCPESARPQLCLDLPKTGVNNKRHLHVLPQLPTALRIQLSKH